MLSSSAELPLRSVEFGSDPFNVTATVTFVTSVTFVYF